MNRITKLFNEKEKDVLSIYYTAGFPMLESTLEIAQHIEEGGADMIEIGIPFSDPVADGPTIQESNKQALDNGMTLKLLFEQLSSLREQVNIPVILMGYINPVLQFGFEDFCKKCEECGVDGLIFPDLPISVYENEYKAICEQYGLKNTFLITPQTSEQRIRQIDENSDGFIYMVSSASTTGAKTQVESEQESYFQRIKDMQLKSPTLVGFGISNHETFKAASKNSRGAIIGSAFINVLSQNADLKNDIKNFINQVKG
ncbi:tryptophan synthase subunit alpha [Fulvivirga sp. RKSG066]|nr:tryptophan synthase subunit alpha [Fulvivirga aurantia]MTI21122.1 tryptophan synthase subunit alpha [Fulvivirga aurantia]